MENEVQNQLTKKERKELKRQEKRSEQGRERRKKTVRRIVSWFIAIVLIGLGGWGIMRLAESPSNGGTVQSGDIPAVSASDHTKGNPDAALTLVEYSDFQCPACGGFYPVLKQISDELGANLRFVYRNFPLRSIHKNAQLAAQAAEAASLQGKFWEMHDKVFETQDEWKNLSGSKAEDTFIGYAEGLGLSVEQFRSDINSSVVTNRVNADYDAGVSAGINSTPTFYLNGKKVDQNSYQSYDEFKQIIVNAIVSQ